MRNNAARAWAAVGGPSASSAAHAGGGGPGGLADRPEGAGGGDPLFLGGGAEQDHQLGQRLGGGGAYPLQGGRRLAGAAVAIFPDDPTQVRHRGSGGRAHRPQDVDGREPRPGLECGQQFRDGRGGARAELGQGPEDRELLVQTVELGQAAGPEGLAEHREQSGRFVTQLGQGDGRPGANDGLLVTQQFPERGQHFARGALPQLAEGAAGGSGRRRRGAGQQFRQDGGGRARRGTEL
jgi:hypothetical protein